MNQNDHLDTQPTDCDDDNSTAQDREIERLLDIIDREIEKPDEEIDYDLIEECTARLDELTPLERPYTDEDIEKNLQKLKDDIRKTEESAKIRSAPTANRWNRPWIKVASAIAACFVVCFSTLSIVAKNQGYGNTWEFVVTNARKIMGMDSGTQTREDKITLIKPTENITYLNIEELLREENLPILYPSNLPENLTIKEVRQVFQNDGKYTLIFVFSNRDYNYKVFNYYRQENYTEYTEIYRVNDKEFYIIQLDENSYLSVIQYNGYEYVIQCCDFDSLTTILNSMKGY